MPALLAKSADQSASLLFANPEDIEARFFIDVNLLLFKTVITDAFYSIMSRYLCLLCNVMRAIW